MRTASARCLLGLLALAAAGCAHIPATEAPGPAVTDPRATAVGGLLESDLSMRYLFRVRYEGPQGSGLLRMIVDLEARQRYAIATKDRFGRGLWRLEVNEGGELLVDERRGIHCRSAAGVRIPEIALESLPLEELPAVLLGRQPGNLSADPEPGEFRDEAGRRWSVVGEVESPTSWTVWELGEPWLWWRRDGSDGGVLSHRGGSQFRWKLVARETRQEPLANVVPDPDSRRVECDDWALVESPETANGH